MSSLLALSMATAQTSPSPGDAFFLDDLLDSIGRPEDTNPEVIADAWGFSEPEPAKTMTEQPLQPSTPSGQEAQECNSSSSEGNNPDLTPSSTTLDLVGDHDDFGDVGDAVLGFGSSHMSSPSDGYEHISLISSQSSTYSYNSNIESLGTGPAAGYPDQSREASINPTSSPLQPQQQQLGSSFGTIEDNEIYQTSLFQGTTGFGLESLSAAGPSYPGVSTSADTALPYRFAPSSQAWPTASFPVTQGHIWGDASLLNTYPHEPVYGHPMRQPMHAAQNYSFPQPSAPYGLVPNTGQIAFGQPLHHSTQPLPSNYNYYALQQAPKESSPRTADVKMQPPRTEPTIAHSTRRRYPHLAATKDSESNRTITQAPKRLAMADLSNTPDNLRAAEEQEPRPAKGGRKKHTHLKDNVRKQSSAMRKKGACWRCKMQRDTCPDDGTPCQRCLNFFESHKNQQHYFACDRSKLPDFVMDFLPPSYTTMHSKQSIEDCVQEQVRYWDLARPVEVQLTSGYGHPISWTLYEFEPATLDLLGQYQYLQDVQTRQSKRYEKWSPPLGLVKLEPSDDWRFKNYLDELMSEGILAEFPWRCYDEESQFDDFQAEMLALVCQLYQKTNDIELKPLLRKIIRMQIITYIMSHTLTITQETLPWVHSNLRNRNKPVYPSPYTSPRLANRQLKFFFSFLRQQMLEDILKWQQTTFQTAARKDSTWLPTFTVMLALAMVLEELQRTMQIQADTKARKREASAAAAQQEAENACERIDARFRLLIDLFQHKYRDRKWTSEGSFGPQTPVLQDPAEREFCRELRCLLVEKQQHLRNRRDVTFSSENQCFYTTRLVARFLLPFLDLPA